jgi:diaminohydroxyphosphoribosylaminopyrimidine deaminase/5-amino-6-(5-phosphoribosylamino)uracil reductase
MCEFSVDDHRLMARALRLAEQGLYTADPNPRVGCVIVRDGEIVGQGWHRAAGEPHAEVHALAEAGERAAGARAYVTLEPCSHHGRTPPCADALVEAGVGQVVVAMQDPNPRVAGEGLARLRQAGIETRVGLMQAEAEALNPGFVRRMSTGRPYVRLKMAMSLDGRTAMASGESQWITGAQAREDVHRLRARSSAIVTGIGTVLADDPSLNARLGEDTDVHQPLRIVLDPRLSMPESARMLQLPGRTVVATASDDTEQHERLQAAGAEVLFIPSRPDVVDLTALLEELARREINEVLVETGATLGGAVLQAGIIDELVLYMAPKLMGDGARGLFRLPGLDTMAQAVELDIRDIRAVGRDWRITAGVKSD